VNDSAHGRSGSDLSIATHEVRAGLNRARKSSNWVFSPAWRHHYFARKTASSRSSVITGSVRRQLNEPGLHEPNLQVQVHEGYEWLPVLEVRHPELARHLRESVSTGSACQYQPSEGVTWIL